MPSLGSVDPAQDPAYLAFARAQGYSEESARSAATGRIDALNRQLANAIPEFQAQEEVGLEGVAGAAEESGVFRSGKRLVDQQRFADSVGRRRSGFEGTIRDSQADETSNLAREIALMRQADAEQRLNTRANLLVDAANAGVY